MIIYRKTILHLQTSLYIIRVKTKECSCTYDRENVKSSANSPCVTLFVMPLISLFTDAELGDLLLSPLCCCFPEVVAAVGGGDSRLADSLTAEGGGDLGGGGGINIGG